MIRQLAHLDHGQLLALANTCEQAFKTSPIFDGSHGSSNPVTAKIWWLLNARTMASFGQLYATDDATGTASAIAWVIPGSEKITTSLLRDFGLLAGPVALQRYQAVRDKGTALIPSVGRLARQGDRDARSPHASRPQGRRRVERPGCASFGTAPRSRLGSFAACPRPSSSGAPVVRAASRPLLRRTQLQGRARGDVRRRTSHLLDARRVITPTFGFRLALEDRCCSL